MNEKLTRTEAENDLLLAAQACPALTAQLVEHCDRFATEQGLQRYELGSSLLVAAIEMLARDGGIASARRALGSVLNKLAEDQAATH